jgi:hypothetical protein
MDRVIPAIREANLIVWATPLYHYGMTARLKRILERTLPMAEPWMVCEEGRFSHPDRYPVPEDSKGAVLISNCGFPDGVHFGPMLEHFKYLCKTERTPLLASILRPMGELLRVPECAPLFVPLKEGLRVAGREIVLEGHLSPETEEALARPVMDERVCAAQANAYWCSCLGDATPPPGAPLP